MSATVSSVTERHNNQSGTINLSGAEFVREFIVKISAADEAGCDISANASSLPAIGAQWPFQVANRVTPLCLSKRVRPLSDDSRQYYLVECEYSNDPTQLSSAQNTQQVIAPWEEDAVYSYDYQEERRALAKDYDGETVANSAHDPFDPMPERTIYFRKITIGRNTLDFDPQAAAAIQDTVNEETIRINGENIESKMAHLVRWTAQTQTYFHPTTNVKTKYYAETLEVIIALQPEGNGLGLYPEGHLLDIVDAGYQYLDGTDKKRFLNDDGTERASPGYLDGGGSPILVDDDTGPVILTFRQYYTASWSALGGSL